MPKILDYLIAGVISFLLEQSTRQRKNDARRTREADLAGNGTVGPLLDKQWTDPYYPMSRVLETQLES